MNYRGFMLYEDEDGWYWKNPYIDAPKPGMLTRPTLKQIKEVVDYFFEYYGDLKESVA